MILTPVAVMSKGSFGDGAGRLEFALWSNPGVTKKGGQPGEKRWAVESIGWSVWYEVVKARGGRGEWDVGPSQEGVDGPVWQHRLIIPEALNVQTEPLGLARWSLPWTPTPGRARMSPAPTTEGVVCCWFFFFSF